MEGGKENTLPGQESGLARMFREGNKAIGTHKTSDLFMQLESRSLTEDEQTIIQQRLDLQRKMLLAYETREKARKIQDLQQVCPELTEEEAQRALDLCNGREDVAAGQIVSDPAFRRRLQPASAAPVPRTRGTARKSATWNAKPSGRRPKQVDATSLGSSVFVGAFRGGKRGGSRTAHLHAAAADVTSSEADLPVTTWRTSRPRSRQKADHPADKAASSRPNPTQAEAQQEPKGKQEQQQDEEECSQAEQIEDEDADAEQKEEEEEQEEEEDDHIEEEEEADAAAPAPMHAEESGELMFEADVVDALANLPSSQPLGLYPHSSSEPTHPAIATGVQLPVKAPGLTADAVTSTLLSPNTGVRQSRRLAALAEAPCQSPSDPHAAQQQGTALHLQEKPPQQQGAAPHQQGRAPEQAEQPGAAQSAEVLQASTLQASANVLKGLTVSTGVKFLHKMQAEAMQGTLDALQGLDSVKADLLRAQLVGSSTVSHQHAVSQTPQLLPAPPGLAPNLELPSADVHSPPAELDSPSADSQVFQHEPQQTLPEKGTAGNTVITSKVPKQASSGGDDPQQTSRSASPDAKASFLKLAPGGTQSKKRKANKADVNVEGDAAAAMEAEHAESAQQAEQEQALPKQATVRSGGGAKKKQGTLQAAFAKAKDAGSQGFSNNEAQQRKRRRTRARAVSNQDTESLPDQAMDLLPEQATKDDEKKRIADAEAAPNQATASEQPQKRGRNIRARRSPDQDMVDDVISDTEAEQEDEASDTDFVAVIKGSKKRVRTATKSPTKKQKSRARPQPQSPAQASPPSSSTAKKAKTAEPVSPGSAPASSSSPSDAVKQRRSRRPSVVARLAEEDAEQAAAVAAAAATSPPKQNKGSGEGRRAKAGSKAQGFSAIARSGHTNRGRVKQKSHKAANILEVGSVRAEKGWYNSGYIFPEGFKSQLPFRSSVELDQLCLHECTIIGKGGAHWPHPTYKVVAMDRADEPLLAKSCTGCWTQVLKRINSEIEARRKAGENLPPPPKTAIAGPEYFGLNQPELTEAIEALDPQHECSEYWDGKADREAAAAGLAPADRGPRPPRPSAGGAPRPKRSRRAREGSDEEADPGREDEEDDESANMTNRWSAVSRTERYRKRCGDEGNPTVDETNPLPKLIDPITLEPVVTPAISPFGHVMGLATWKAVLAEQGKCPFTKNDLSWEQCTTLTLSNIDRYRDRIKSL
ncbi:hypothetical protein WJX77_003930 [Trebouxia sp. C0004]